MTKFPTSATGHAIHAGDRPPLVLRWFRFPMENFGVFDTPARVRSHVDLIDAQPFSLSRGPAIENNKGHRERG